MKQQVSVTDFLYWKKKKTLDSPFPDAKVNGKTVFLRQHVSSMWDVNRWDVFPDIFSLGGWLWHMFFPFAFGNILRRDEWDEDDRKISVKDLLIRAEAAGGECPTAQDISLMRELDEALEKALVLDRDPKKVANDVKKVITKFNKRAKKAGLWSFALELCESPVEVGNSLYKAITDDVQKKFADEEFENQTGMKLKDWAALCKRVLVGTAKDVKRFEEVVEAFNLS